MTPSPVARSPRPFIFRLSALSSYTLSSATLPTHIRLSRRATLNRGMQRSPPLVALSESVLESAPCNSYDNMLHYAIERGLRSASGLIYSNAGMRPQLRHMEGAVMERNKEWLSVQEAADYLGVARTTIYRWAKESKLRIYKLAKGVARVKRQDLEAFLQKAAVLYPDPAGHPAQPDLLRETARQQSQAADPILDVLGSLSGEPISAEEIEEELYGKEERR